MIRLTASPQPVDVDRAFGVAYGGAHVTPAHAFLAGAEGCEQGFVGQDVHQTRHATGMAVQGRARRPGKQAVAPVAGDAQTMFDIGIDLFAAQSRQPVMEGDALAQLPDPRLAQFFIQLRLTEQHNLDQLALFGLEIRNQPQRLQRQHRHRLRLVDA